MKVVNKDSTQINTEAVKGTANKKANFRVLTKEQVEVDRSKAYSYVR